VNAAIGAWNSCPEALIMVYAPRIDPTGVGMMAPLE
jgi:hypothetical protein